MVQLLTDDPDQDEGKGHITNNLILMVVLLLFKPG